MIKALYILAALALPATVTAQSRPEIFILGTFHMANSGKDIHNTETDDVLSVKRQKEMTELLDVLKRFRPTKIAIESEVTSDRRPKQYAEYSAGTYTQLTANEIEQIGFRLAKELGHPKIYNVDADGDFPYTRVLNYAKANNMKAKFDSLEASVAARVKKEQQHLRTHTLVEALRSMNSDSAVTRENNEYAGFVFFGEPWEYAGPDLLAAWYQRNIRIYRNIRALVESPNERVLVIYGKGHLGLLRQNVANDATVTLRKLSDY